MPVTPGEYTQILGSHQNLEWNRPEGEPEGVTEALLRKHPDGSLSRLLRIRKGVEYFQPAKHDFYEEVYYIQGEMLNKKTKKRIRGGAYVYHEPGEEHGPLKCLENCLMLEFRYYK